MIDGQNMERPTHPHIQELRTHTHKKQPCLEQCVSRPLSSGCRRYILLHGSLPSNGVSQVKADSSCDAREQAGLWTHPSQQPIMHHRRLGGRISESAHDVWLQSSTSCYVVMLMQLQLKDFFFYLKTLCEKKCTQNELCGRPKLGSFL